MGISVFPAGGGEFISNDFVVDMNDTSNNVATLGTEKAAGSYGVTLASGDTSFDIYALDADGNSVGYTNDASLVATSAFSQVVVLGVANSEVISFDYNGAVSNTDSEGDAVGAGAYLTSISPSDLPAIDDTANVVGGNFATDVEIYFESGTVSTAAKQVARADSTALIITRPDSLDPSLDPWDVKAINPGITPPTGSNAHILAGTVDAGANPAFQTTSPLPLMTLNQAYSATVVATDADGQTVDYAITAGSLPTGLSFDGVTGVFSGTPTTPPTTITVTASDTAGNDNDRQFDFSFQKASGGTVTEADGYWIHTFTASDDFEVIQEIPELEYLVIAGGGAGGSTNDIYSQSAGGGGGGGYRSSVSGESSGSATTAESPLTSVAVGTVAVTVGAGGAVFANAPGFSGGDSSFGTLVTTTGGGGGARGINNAESGRDGGSGGGAGSGNNASLGGSGTSGEGFSGGDKTANGGFGGGGGGAGGAATATADGGVGITSSITGGSVGRAGGGGGGVSNNADGLANEGGGDGASESGRSPSGGTDGTGGGGGGAKAIFTNNAAFSYGASGGDGIVIVRYAQ